MGQGAQDLCFSSQDESPNWGLSNEGMEHSDIEGRMLERVKCCGNRNSGSSRSRAYSVDIQCLQCLRMLSTELLCLGMGYRES